ncbi:polyprenyl diphosphate synthase [Streptomyces griseocarneus]|uniref:polyprenyl diphosphate synthase n=1 Tax=Streptomyces griseocarneus TaxID=51201 RepID=UPI00199BFD99|nr:polyprenyl diphosphate synthase [Streptomyces griseocarneus]MBZ6478106.1 di-trans,poly-cis-decaprenylcistransferase [Streptomyces griseocarneus]GHG83709.1 isoprenyl transferase [Streptomyces griseocarneus]
MADEGARCLFGLSVPWRTFRWRYELKHLGFEEQTVDFPPQHIALIMDGNGRWADRRRLERIDGHSAGEEAIVAAVLAARESGVAWLTLFAFSTENWNRPQGEVDFLMQFNQRVIRNNAAPWHRLGIRMRYLGNEDERIPAFVREDIAYVEGLTRDNTEMTLTMAFDHGGRRDLARAARSVVEAGLAPEQVTEDALAAHMQYPDLPDIDLLVRTSGEHRLSNFMLWQAAYAELVFLDVLWPDFRAEHLDEAVALYHRRQRRFGAVTKPATVQRGLLTGSAGAS